jgi:DNA-binding response OmpR family regulator
MKLSEELAKAAGRWSVLVIDADPSVARMVEEGVKPAGAAPGDIRRVRHAATLEAAELEMRRSPADVVFINLQVADNAGTELIRSFKRRWPKAEAIAISRVRRSEVCLEAWRAGAADMLHEPLHPREVQQALAQLSVRKAGVDRLAERNERLRIVCRRLNKARHEISQQVDLLCNDLVRAYQDMAQQLNQTQLAADYSQSLKSEIEIEGILRRTMEWILQRLGPINAAVYLPNGEDHFALGAYLNLDTQADGPMIEAIGKTVVQQVRSTNVLSMDTDAALAEQFGDEARLLRGRMWLAMSCRTPRDCLAALVIFRKQGDSSTSDATVRAMAEAMAPVLAERIEQALGFYQRLHPFQEDDNAGGQEMDLE